MNHIYLYLKLYDVDGEVLNYSTFFIMYLFH